MTSVMSQTNARIRQLEKQRSELLDNMRKSEQLLAKAGKDISSQLNASSSTRPRTTMPARSATYDRGVAYKRS